VKEGEPWEKLREKEVVGIYISGHPLDDFNSEIKAFCNCKFFTNLMSWKHSKLGSILLQGNFRWQHGFPKNGKDGYVYWKIIG